MSYKMQRFKYSVGLVLFIVAQGWGQAEQPSEPQKSIRPTSFWPAGVSFDASIITPKAYLGFEIGQRHLEHHQLVGYLEKLAGQTNRIEVQQYGKTHGKRPLLLLTVTSPSNHERLDTIRKQHRDLADPEKSKTIDLTDVPAVINMGYGVHGDEASATNCSALVAYYLAAAQGDEIDRWLQQCIVLLDPCLNPDGFNRFANWVNGYRGAIPNDDPQHREHNQSWPSGRVNYYWFDLNRDWLPLEHPESQSRMRWYHAWKPNVVLDFHEMGTNSTYFFQPGVPRRTNPMTPAKNIELTGRFAQYHGKALDQAGSFYFTQELFDDFYMGKGSTYPDLHGAVGILFEQASARGHAQKHQDGRLTFHSAIANHFATSLSSLRATAEMRQELLEYKRDFFVDSMKMAESRETSAFVFTSENNLRRLLDFADVLIRHDIQCFWPKQTIELDGKLLKKRRSLVVPVAQPEYRFLKSLLTRRKNFPENVFYDVSSWTLPLAYNLKQTSVGAMLDFNVLDAVKLGKRMSTSVDFDEQAIGYIVDWRDDSSSALLSQLLKTGVNVKVATRSFRAKVTATGGLESFEPGTLLIQIGIQPRRRKGIEKTLASAARRGTQVFPVFTGLTDQGPDLGSNRFRRIEKPAIAMPVGPGIAQYEAGEIWHLMDHCFGIQLSMLDVDRFSRYDMREYRTFLLPTGTYANWTEKEWGAIAGEVKRGGTAIAIGSTCDLVARKLTGKTAEAEAEGSDADALLQTQLAYDSAAQRRALKLISGAIFQTRIDRTNPLFFGFPSDRLAVFRNHGKFLLPSRNPYCNPGIYDRKQPHLAGYCSPENIEKFKTSASVVVVPIGQGRLIQISDNPNFRAFWRGTKRLFLNAIFFGEHVNPRSGN